MKTMLQSFFTPAIRNTIFIILALAYFPATHADSPPNLTADIPWLNGAYNNVADIEAAFNNARRQEEIQLSLAVNTIQDLDLPSDATWNSMSIDQKAFYLLNDERTARAGMLAGVIGLPFAAVEQSIDTIAGDYATLLVNTDTFGHYEPGGLGVDSPARRIEQNAVIGSKHRANIVYGGASVQHDDSSAHFYGDSYNGLSACHEFMARTENLAAFSAFSTQPIGASSIPFPLERAIYNWIYDDSSSAWGHREAALLQDETLAQPTSGWGFDNNNGGNQHEGYLGFHVLGSTDYTPFGPPPFPFSYGVAVVMNIFDPVSDAQQTALSCSYTETVTALPTTCNGQAITVDLNMMGSPTSADDVILGTPGMDTINGMGGNDTICALGGNDVINGGRDNDWIDAGEGDDEVLGANGVDMIFGGSGNDQLNGGPGDDFIYGEENDDTIFGNSGSDVIEGGDGVDDIRGGSGNDNISTGPGATVGTSKLVDGGSGNDTITGGPDADVLRGSTDMDIIRGGDGDDQLYGGGGEDMVYGEIGADLIRGNAADDFLSGGPGIDNINGYGSKDTIEGGDGDDILNGSTGNDIIRGGLGNDEINGGGGNDDLLGQENNDTILGGGGNDNMNGGDGTDSCDGQSGTGDTAIQCETVNGIP